MSVALKVVHPILFSWPTRSEATVGGVAVVVAPSPRCPVTLCGRVTDGSSGTLTLLIGDR